MKRKIVVLALVAASSYFFSCKRPQCLTPGVSILLVSADSIPDTIENVVIYKKGSGFSKVVDSFNTPLFSLSSGSTSNPNNKGIGVGYQTYNIYSYDWMFTLFPSGKVYKLTNFSHSNDHDAGYGEITENCVNSVSCNINDSTYKVSPAPTNDWSTSTALFVKY